MSRLFIVLDGSGDRDYRSLGNKSPLGYARTPHIDSLARLSRMGRVEVVGKGIAPESDSAVMSLLGYDVHKDFPGRGVIESRGAGWKIRKSCVYFRANFATIDDNWNLIDTRANRIKDEYASRIAKEISRIELKGVKFDFIHTIGHRGVLRVCGKGLSPNITGNHNGYEIIKGSNITRALVLNLPAKLKSFRPLDSTYEAKNTAMLMNLFVRIIYDKLSSVPLNKRLKFPANMLLLRGAGNKFFRVDSMRKKTGLRWAALVEMPVERGICDLVKMDIIYLGDELESDVKRTKRYLKATLENMSKYDALYIHIKGPDIPGHDGDLKKKIRSIEIIDRHFFGPLLKSIDLGSTSIVVTADHSTECALKAHTSRPTPLMLYKPGAKPDGLESFSEDNCSKGSIGTIRGMDIVRLLL